LRKFERFAFNYAWSLEQIIFPPNVRIIGGFRQCTKLVSLQLSNCLQLEKFYENAFETNIALRDIQFPPTLRIIDSYAFQKCKSLQLHRPKRKMRQNMIIFSDVKAPKRLVST